MKERFCEKHKPENPYKIRVGDIVASTCGYRRLYQQVAWKKATVLECDYDVCLIELPCGCRKWINYHWIELVPTFRGKCCDGCSCC